MPNISEVKLEKLDEERSPNFLQSIIFKFILGLLASVLVFAFGGYVTSMREAGNHEARITSLERQVAVNTVVISTQNSQDVKIAALEKAMDDKMSKSEFSIYYGNIMATLEEIKHEQTRIRTELEMHSREVEKGKQ
jgi:ribosomal protein L24